jgi:hypothetical protein
MSKARQIYYNAVFGAIGGLLAWLVVGSVGTGSWPIWLAYPFVGAGAGLFIGASTGVVDGIVNKQAVRPALTGGISGGLVGLCSGAIGLLLGESTFLLFGGGMLGRVFGWLLLGLLLGLGDGLVNRSTLRASYGAIGGTVAGAVGGLLYEGMTQLFLRQSDYIQMIVGALGLLLIGACLGGIIPATITLLARGKLHVLTGRKEGAVVDVVDAVTLGSYDGCELYLPGDSKIAKKHARVHRDGNHFFITALDATRPTSVNGTLIGAGTASPINRGAQLLVGNTQVEFL